MALNDINQMFSITDPETGKPTDYLMRLLRDRGVAAEDVEQLVADLNVLVLQLQQDVLAKADKVTEINAGTGLAGGGDLSANRTLTLNALLDNLLDVDTTTTPPTDQQALLYDLALGLWIPGTVASGGGSSGGQLPWTVISTTVIGAPVASVTAIGLAGYTDLMIIARDVTTSTSDFRLVDVSTDNGATYFTTSGNYVIPANTGVTTANIAALATSAASAAARTFGGIIHGSNVNGSNKICSNIYGADNRIFVANTLPIDAVRVRNLSGNLTGGTIYILGRPGTAGGTAVVRTQAADDTISPATVATYCLLSNAGTKLINIATEATTALPDSGEWHFRNTGAGNATVTPAVGVTVTPPAGGTLIIPQDGTVTLKRVAANTFHLFGQTT